MAVLSACSYEAPENYTACIAALGPITTGNYAQAIQCETIYGQGNYHNSMLALDMTTGAVRWVVHHACLIGVLVEQLPKPQPLVWAFSRNSCALGMVQAGSES